MRFEPPRTVPVTAILLGIGAIGLATVGVFMESDTPPQRQPTRTTASSDLVEIDTERFELPPSAAGSIAAEASASPAPPQ